MALRVFRNEELWFELSGNRFHRNDLAMIESFLSQIIYNSDEDFGCSDADLDANQYEFQALFEKFQFNRSRYINKLNNFLQPYHLEIVIVKE